MIGWKKRGALVVVGVGALAVGIASCGLTDFEPPPAGSTASGIGAGGAGVAASAGPGGGSGGSGAAGGGGGTCDEGVSKCLALVPSGWAGPFWGKPDVWDSSPQTCPDNHTPTTLLAAPSSNECTACECSVDEAAKCEFAAVTCWNNAQCDSSGSSEQIQAGCITGTLLPGGGLDTSCKVTGLPSPDANAVCVVTDGGLLLQPDLGQEKVYLCPATKVGSDCPNGGSCVTPPPGFHSDYACITTDNSVSACPVGWTDKDIAAFTTMSEGRSCSACTCDSKLLDCPLEGVFLKTNVACGNGGTPFSTASDNCTKISTLEGVRVTPPTPIAGPDACSVSQGQGEVKTDGPTTVCCAKLF